MAVTTGLDFAWSKPSPATAWSAGYRFVCRYLSWLPTSPGAPASVKGKAPNGKVITSAEYLALRRQGFTVFLNWEFDSQDALGGASAGKAHATEAVRQARALGYPAGKTIYFSADFNQTPGQEAATNAYMKAAKAVVNAAGYRMGIYGGYYPVMRALNAGVVDDAWQTYAWSGGQWDSRAGLRQVQNGITVGGADCDRDEIHGPVYGDGPLSTEDGALMATDAQMIAAKIDNLYTALAGWWTSRRIEALGRGYRDLQGDPATEGHTNEPMWAVGQLYKVDDIEAALNDLKAAVADLKANPTVQLTITQDMLTAAVKACAPELMAAAATHVKVQ